MILLLVLLWDHVLALQPELVEFGVFLGNLGLKLGNLVLVFVLKLKNPLIDLITKSLFSRFGLMHGLVHLIHLLFQDLIFAYHLVVDLR